MFKTDRDHKIMFFLNSGHCELFLGSSPRALDVSHGLTISMTWLSLSKELINKNKPLWLRPAEGVTHEEYAELYKFLSADWEDCLQLHAAACCSSL